MNPAPIQAVGSIPLDTLETPHGRRGEITGGSDAYFAVAAALFAPLRLVGVLPRRLHLPRSGLGRIRFRIRLWVWFFAGVCAMTSEWNLFNTISLFGELIWNIPILLCG